MHEFYRCNTLHDEPPHPDSWLKGLVRTCWTTGFQKMILLHTWIIYLPTYTLAFWSYLLDGDQTFLCYFGKWWKPFYQGRASFICLLLVLSLMSFLSSHWELCCSSHKCLLLRKMLPSSHIFMYFQKKSTMTFLQEEEIISIHKPVSFESSIQEPHGLEFAIAWASFRHGGRTTQYFHLS